ncbi:unnamed protein product [Dibothriocephalus latus]|uniref:PLAT domain-containing protein n=1 Tax=Dibothriocephalus latus TaxID=60516 RepID=A0A3P6U160_DIBLA|nr:unnamed protein product [Dibothriocephalus latus]
MQGAGTTADVFVQLADKNKTAGEHWLRVDRRGRPSTSNMEKSSYTFSEGSVVEAEVNCSQPLNQLSRLRVGHNNRGQSPDWFLEKVMVKDLDRNQTFTFQCNQWISQNRGDGLLVRDLYIEKSNKLTPEKARKSHDFEVELVTRRGSTMGTPKNLLLKLYGPPPRYDEIRMKDVNVSPLIRIAGKSIKFEETNWFKFKIPNHEKLIPCRKLDSSTTVEAGQIPWRVEVYTSERLNAGSSARLTIVLYGSTGKSEEVILTDEPTSDRRKRFIAGSCATFIVKMPPVGQPYKLRIGRDNHGITSNWHLEKVVLQNLLDGKSYYFPCSQWISGDAGGGILYREMPASGINVPNPPQCMSQKHTKRLD